MALPFKRPSITYWNRVEPSPHSESLQPALEATVRDPLWFLTRQWQLGEFQGEDAASAAFASFSARFSGFDGWRAEDGRLRPLGGAPLETLVEDEASTPDLRTAVELGQALERRLTAGGATQAVIRAFRNAFPVRRADQLSVPERRDKALVRLARVCGGRATHGIAALRAAEVAAPEVPGQVTLPAGSETLVRTTLAWFTGWARATFGAIGSDDAEAWRPDRLEYALDVAVTTPDGDQTTLRAHAGPHGEFDWYAFDQVGGTQPKDEPAPASLALSFLPVPVSLSGMPNARWWNFEDGRFNWANVDTDRRDLAKVMVVDFMLVQGNDWFMVPFGQEVGTLVRVDQLLVRDVFGEWTLVGRADADPGAGRARWTMFSTDSGEARTGLADWFVLPPSALRSTLDGPDLEEVRFVRDEQANMAWAVEAVTEDGTGRPWSGRERALEVPEGAPPSLEPIAPLRYRLQTTVPVNWIPFVPVQVDAARRAVALERGTMQRFVDGVLTAVTPAGRVLRPSGLADPDVYRVQEEEVARTGTRVLRAARRTRWTDGSTYWWTSRLRRAGMGEVASGLRYDVAEPTDQAGG